MGCLQKNEDYEGKIIAMSYKRNKKNVANKDIAEAGPSGNSNSDQQGKTLSAEDIDKIARQTVQILLDQQQNNKHHLLESKFSEGLSDILKIVPSIASILSVFVVGWGLSGRLSSIETIIENDMFTVADLRETDLATNEDLDTVEKELSTQIDNLDDDITDLDKRLTVVEQVMSIKSINLTGSVSGELLEVGVEPNGSTYVKSSIEKDTIIGTDSEGKAYTAENLAGQESLLTYKDGEKEAYFLGSLMKNIIGMDFVL